MSEDVLIRVDGSTLSVKKGTSVMDALRLLSLARKPVLASVDGEVFGLDVSLEKSAEVKVLFTDSEEGLEILRHSAAHLLAHAVVELFPGTQIGVGPAVENGFYYDFLRETPFSPEDLTAIEARMKEIVERHLPIRKLVYTKSEAIKVFKDAGQRLKVELIEEKGGDEVTVYAQGDFLDFCLGPHVPSTGYIRNFKLLSVSGAYWKGDEKGIQLQRIYGTAFYEKDQLEAYLRLLEEAKKRDHRRLGVELDLFSFNEDLGGGLILWHPKGATIRHLIEEYWREEHVRDGYEFLYTPHIGKLDIWRKSGHTEFYEAMFPCLLTEGVEYELKPMNCPFHIMVYKARQRSYRDLPLRWAELGTVYRFERSGVLHGLLRVRGFTQDDAHIFCREDQLEAEITKVIFLARRLLMTFGFDDYDVFLSTRPEKYVGRVEDWEKATRALEKALQAAVLGYRVDEGEGVFYGPKIDIKIKDALGRSWQCTTIQLDFNLAERFELSYAGEDGALHRPFLIHRALLGSLERFFGILIEHYNGNFPLWLAPIQVIILPIADRHHEYAISLETRFKERGLRTRVDVRREKIGYKVRDAESQKIPLILVVGDKEMASGKASLRVHTQGDRGEVEVGAFLEKILDLNKNKALTLTF